MSHPTDAPEPTDADWADLWADAQAGPDGIRGAVGADPWADEHPAPRHLAPVTPIVGTETAPQMPWAPIDLAHILAAVQAGQIVGPQATLMPRTDGIALLYPGELHSFAAEPESGKTWLLLAETARLIGQGARVLFVDFEDSAANVVARLLAVGAAPNAIVQHFAYVNPDRAFRPDELERLLTGVPFTLAVLDGMSEAYSLLGLDPYSNADAAKFLQILPRPIATRGAAVALIDHVVKDAQGRGRFALGAGHKLAGVAVAYGIEVITPPSRGHTGHLKLIVQKDRHGRIREHAGGGKAPVVALAQITPADGGHHVTVELNPPDAKPDGEPFRPTVLMERISDHLAENPGATRNAILDAVQGKKEWKTTALTLLVTEGHARREVDGQAHRHHLITPYRVPGSQPGPTGSPDPAGTTGSPGPTPSRGPGPGTQSPHQAETATGSRPRNALTADIDGDHA